MNRKRNSTLVNPSDPIIILFDGQCNLCSKVVAFIMPRDPQGKFRFASLQSETGMRLLREHGMSTEEMNSIVLIEGSRHYTKSHAALIVARNLSGMWPIAYAFIVIPRSVRDRLYDFVAKRRYAWFAQSDSCLLPTNENKGRFLE